MNKNRAIAFGFAASILIPAFPVLAHHPNGGETPSNFIQGFLSGLGHPVIGIDHLVFVVAIGLLAALSKKKRHDYSSSIRDCHGDGNRNSFAER